MKWHKVVSASNFQACSYIHLDSDMSTKGIRTCTIEDLKLLHEQSKLNKEETKALDEDNVYDHHGDEEEFSQVNGKKKKKKNKKIKGRRRKPGSLGPKNHNIIIFVSYNLMIRFITWNVRGIANGPTISKFFSQNALVTLFCITGA